MTSAVAVAVSGGRDSIALLHAVHRAAPAALAVHALHVHHGLLPAADDWEAHVRSLCARWKLPLHVRRLEGKVPRGESVEAWARRERYGALAEMARAAGATLVLLAHHRRDQAETFLLQALRGAGAAGLAAMPRLFERDGMTFARPWLGQPREAIEHYLRRHRLRHVDDSSNDDPRFARNRLRLQVWPALTTAFADVEVALAAAARRAAQDREVLAEVAQADLQNAGETLPLATWRTLSPARRANALREWLRRRMGRGVPESLLERLLGELEGEAPARWPLTEGVELTRYRGTLSVVHLRASPPSAPVALRIHRAGVYRVPGWTGALRVTRVREGGVPLSVLREARLQPRLGAEQFQAGPNRPPRSLKKQFQAAGVPAWQRDAPLLWGPNGLLFVPGLGIDARARAMADEPQAALEWLRD